MAIQTYTAAIANINDAISEGICNRDLVSYIDSELGSSNTRRVMNGYLSDQAERLSPNHSLKTSLRSEDISFGSTYMLKKYREFKEDTKLDILFPEFLEIFKDLRFSELEIPDKYIPVQPDIF